MNTCGYLLGILDKAIPIHPGDRLKFGRESDNDFVFNDGLTSRYHAVLSVDEAGAVTLEDLGSTNQTWLNETPIQPKLPMPLTSRDIFRVGGKVITFYANTEDVAPALGIQKFDSDGGTIRLDADLTNSVERSLAERKAEKWNQAQVNPHSADSAPDSPERHLEKDGHPEDDLKS